ncbi:NAD(P)-dependent oxidoreductase [Paraflavitalea sp. CAU 1676]|uniref:NAD(P)-dependent oxidoreductase n=1 Tax=Paraflavitalea sp. CAU 1676 TaxID=3032598 RepID=UPI0023D9E791|nr:NAD(P)-dependent oxidoreductase [Paraflavitalea sp. CAU 1676]MDF2187650.1 NAD(P)-dependent oxidoreductase [Paraflavitalea sp. CAU 1676]
MTYGFIGLGSLGTPIALNILERGHSLLVYNRTIEKTKPLADKGATVCHTIAELAAQADIVFTMVADDAALKTITAGENGLLQHLQPGALHVSMSTILAQTAGELAALHEAKGQQYLAAPVFGRPDAAAARKLNFVISGPQAVREQATPLLKDAGGAGVWDFGDDVLTANTIKICGNFLIASAMEAIGESVLLAKNSGVDPHKMWEMFGQTIFNTPLYQNYSKIILNQQFEPAAFTAKLGLKDLNLVLDQGAKANQSLPLADLLKKHMTRLVENGQASIDWSAVSLGAK